MANSTGPPDDPTPRLDPGGREPGEAPRDGDVPAEPLDAARREVSHPEDPRGAGEPPAPPVLEGFADIRLIGRGGQGEVYQARQIALKRDVAIKILRDRPARERARFQLQAEVLGRFRHPNIVRIYASLESGDSLAIVMELVDGETLDRHIARGLPPPGEAARWTESMARAVHAVHLAHVIHRDLKPANVFLTGEGVPMIVDFGLAKRLDGDDGLTIPGGVCGTPGYMAPEQAQGRTEWIDKRTDVYGLGATLYALLTGRPPFPAVRGRLAETLHRTTEAEPERPRRFNPSVPPDLEAICLTCLQKVQSGRYATAEALAEDLGRFLSGEPTIARPVRPLERALRWARGHRAIAALGGALAVVCVLALGLVLWQWRVAVVNARAARQSADDFSRANRRLGVALVEAERQRHNAQLNSARVSLNQGLAFCETGEIARGILGLARILGELPADETELNRVVRLNLAQWSRAAHRLRLSLKQPDEVWLGAAALSPDGQSILTCGGNQGAQRGEARMWDATSGRPTGVVLPVPIGLESVAFSPDGRIIVTGSVQGTSPVPGEARLWEITRSGIVHRILLPHPGAVNDVAISPDGKTVLTGCTDGKARFWDVASGKLLKPPLEHRGQIVSVAFSPDGKTALTGSYDNTARLWQVSTGRPLGVPMTHRSKVMSVAFSPDGRKILTASADGAATLGMHGQHSLRAGRSGIRIRSGMKTRPSGRTARQVPEQARSRPWPSVPTARPWQPQAPTAQCAFGTRRAPNRSVSLSCMRATSAPLCSAGMGRRSSRARGRTPTCGRWPPDTAPAWSSNTDTGWGP
jgi:hypothetical protein